MIALVIIVIFCVVAKKKYCSNKEEVVTVTEPYYDYIVSSTLKAVRTLTPALSDQDLYRTEAATTCTFVEDSKNDELLNQYKVESGRRDGKEQIELIEDEAYGHTNSCERADGGEKIELRETTITCIYLFQAIKYFVFTY